MSTPDPVFLILSFEHPTNAVDSVAEAMAHGLRDLGVPTEVCTLPRDLPRLAARPAEQVAGILSMGSLPLSARLAGRPLWEHFPVPVSVYLLDALIYDLARVPAMGDFLVAALQDPRLSLVSPEDGYRQWLGDALPVRWSQMAFGAFARVQPFAAPVNPQPRLCVVGTVGSELGGSPVGESLDALLERLLGGHVAPALLRRAAEALQAADADPMPAATLCRALGWAPRQALTTDYLKVVVAVDSWVKRDRRIAAVRSLAGVPCDFFGHGWQALLGDVPGFRHVGQIRHEDIARLVPHYLGLVNFDPNWAHGLHDRIYTVTAMGGRVLTNTNAALTGAALPAAQLATYDPNRPALADAVMGAGWLERLAPVQPNAALLARHSWSARMAAWLCPAPLGAARPAVPTPPALPTPPAMPNPARAAGPALHPLMGSMAL